jgi:pyroglutamyl-peptidase
LDIVAQTHGDELIFLRKLPVETATATEMVLEAIKEHNPKAIICCGMAASRPDLTLESQAISEAKERLANPLDLNAFIKGLFNASVSDDAGSFVCNGVYYNLLNHLKATNDPTPCLFIHVPLLTGDNTAQVLADFEKVLKNIS